LFRGGDHHGAATLGERAGIQTDAALRGGFLDPSAGNIFRNSGIMSGLVGLATQILTGQRQPGTTSPAVNTLAGQMVQDAALRGQALSAGMALARAQAIVNARAIDAGGRPMGGIGPIGPAGALTGARASQVAAARAAQMARAGGGGLVNRGGGVRAGPGGMLGHI